MISLALRGKVALGEDVLTAAVLDLLRTRSAALLFELLSLPKVSDGSLPAVVSFERATFELWPNTPAGEPDARVGLFVGGREIQRIIVECKLGATKSGIGTLDEGLNRGDQLARYLVHEEASATKNVNVAVLYLTHHARAPDKELAESVRSVGPRVQQPELKFWWLSWRDVHAFLAAREEDASVIELLRRAGMTRFTGFELPLLSKQFDGTAFYTRSDGRSRRKLGGYAWPSIAGTRTRAAFYEGTE